MIKRLILGLAALALTSCGMLPGTLATQPTPIPTLTPAASIAQDAAVKPAPALGGKPSGDLLVWIFSNHTPPVRGVNTFEALVTDSQGQPISDATVSFDIDMTNMSHGKNVMAASSLGNGHYDANVHFLMPGPWRVIVGVRRAGQTSTVRFDFMVSW